MLPILWANIIADIPPALSLGLEPAEADIMERRPRPVNESVITWPIALLVFFQGMSIALISLGVYMTAIQNPSWGAVTVKQQQSLTFAALVSMQLVHSFLSKSVTNSLLFTGVLNNLWMIFAFFISFGLLVLGLYQPDMAHWLEFEFVTGVGWGIVFISCAIHIINVELLKTAYRRFMIPYLAQTKATEKRF